MEKNVTLTQKKWECDKYFRNTRDEEDNVYQEPFDGYRANANYKGYKIFHPTLKKHVPVEMHCDADWCDEELYIKSELSVKDYISRLKLWSYIQTI